MKATIGQMVVSLQTGRSSVASDDPFIMLTIYREETWPYEWYIRRFKPPPPSSPPALITLIVPRGTTKDDDTDDEKTVDQPQKHKRNDIPGPADNNTFEGVIANYIADGVAHSTIDPTILQSFNGDGFTAQGSLLPDK